jgi:hypothetical protein
MPFADDVRKYSFASLDHLINKKGEVVTKHPYIPTDEQQEVMNKFVDAMDLMHAGEKDEEGCVFFPLSSLSHNLSVITESAIRGSTHACPTIPPYTARNKHSSTAQSFKTLHRIPSLHHTLNFLNISNLQRKS